MDSRGISTTTTADRARAARMDRWQGAGWCLPVVSVFLAVSAFSLACARSERAEAVSAPSANVLQASSTPTDAPAALGPVTSPVEPGNWWPGQPVASATLFEQPKQSRDAVATAAQSNPQPDRLARAGRRDGGRTELRLPWSAGETWYLTSGPHERSRAALDFAPPNLDPKTQRPYADACSRERSQRHWVRAVARGRVASVLKRGCPLVEIEHEDGTASNYFHLDTASVRATGLKVGSPVAAGQILGHPSCEIGPPACGASQPATGVHVHFYRTVAKTRKRLPAHGLVLSGWKVRAVGKMREGILVSGEDRRSTRGIAVGRTCPPDRASCAGQRNDLQSDNAAPISDTTLAVGASWYAPTSAAR